MSSIEFIAARPPELDAGRQWKQGQERQERVLHVMSAQRQKRPANSSANRKIGIVARNVKRRGLFETVGRCGVVARDAAEKREYVMSKTANGASASFGIAW